MVAAAFKGSLTFRCMGSGRLFSVPFTASDVTTAAIVFQDGGTLLNLPSTEGIVQFVDISLTAAGTDTSIMYLYANQKDTGDRLYNGLNLGTANVRQLMTAPIPIKPGAQIKLTQIT